jgi:outer membrane lipoprotein-sorting protein
MNEPEKQEAEFARLVSRATGHEAPRVEHQAELRERMLTAFEASQRNVRPIPVWKRTYQHGRAIMRRPIPRLVAMSVPCVLLLAGWIFLREPKSASAAFYEFAHSLVTAKTARFQMEVTIPGQPKVIAKSLFMAPARMRQNMDDLGMVNISDMKAGKIVTLNSKLKTAMVITLIGRPEKMVKSANLDLFDRLREMLADKDVKDSTYQPVGEKEIDGRRTLGFRQDSPMATVTIWGDPETGLPVQINTVMSGPSQLDVLWTDFELNVPVDESEFDLKPPADYQVQQFEMDASPFKEQDLIETLRLASEINEGEFPDSLDTETSQRLIVKSARTAKSTPDEKVMEKFMKIGARIGRGFSFAMQLPSSADARYAGKGVTREAKDTPVFWYRPEGAKLFRVIDADLTVHEAETAPEAPGAVRVGSDVKASKPADE